MATLVLSTVGSLLGGPVGGAIGSLVGQSIDQQIFSSARRGPRIGDLGVQTSSYGTQIARIYGTMRVAGSIVWATDLVESAATTGAKGQPDTTFSYSVSFAVALSSRPVSAISRIWADGKLLRGEGGDFKVSTEFRFFTGAEDQVADPLIASIEGLANTPAYRGLALAVFENLELAEFGNRIPFLTFEVVADASPPPLASLLADASEGRIACSAPTTMRGYGATGRSIRDAVEPLIDMFAVDLVDDGDFLRSPLPANAIVGEDDLGASADATRAAQTESEQTPARLLPASVVVTYYDPQRDYQTGQARSEALAEWASEAKVELPAVASASDARTLAEDLLARRWAQRDKLTLRLPPKYIALEPGATLHVPGSPVRWQLQRLTFDSFVAVGELRPLWRAEAAVTGVAGRVLAHSDVVAGDVVLALVELPDVTGDGSTSPTLYLAASRATPGWKAVPVEVSCGAFVTSHRTAARKSLLGEASSVLGDGQPWVLDLVNIVEVEMIDHDQWLTSCDDDALAGGANLALVGDELVQFGDAQPLGQGHFRLSRLLRGRGGTEWAMPQHAPGDTFLMISPSSLRPLSFPTALRGAQVTSTHVSAVADSSATATLNGEAFRPPAPIGLTAIVDDSGQVHVGWTRRSRSGWAWVDEVDVPLGERVERYFVLLIGSVSTIERQASLSELTLSQSEVGALGSGSVSIQVRQIGDWAASHPATLTISLS
jgi:hypothetical protein